MLIEEKNEELEKNLFNQFSWKIKSINLEDESTASVEVQTINRDFKEIYTKWIKTVINEKKDNNTLLKEKAIEKLNQIIKEEKLKRTETKKINLIKENKKWKIWIDNNLRDIVFPGVDVIDSALSNT